MTNRYCCRSAGGRAPASASHGMPRVANNADGHAARDKEQDGELHLLEIAGFHQVEDSELSRTMLRRRRVDNVTCSLTKSHQREQGQDEGLSSRLILPRVVSSASAQRGSGKCVSRSRPPKGDGIGQRAYRSGKADFRCRSPLRERDAHKP